MKQCIGGIGCIGLVLSAICCGAVRNGDELLRRYDEIARCAATREAGATQRRVFLKQMTADEFDAFIRSVVAANVGDRDLAVMLSQFAGEFHAREENAGDPEGVCAKASSAEMPWQWRAVLLKTWKAADGQQWTAEVRRRVYARLAALAVDAGQAPVVSDAAFGSLMRFLDKDWRKLHAVESRIGAAVRADATLDETAPVMARLPDDLAERARLVMRTLGELRQGLDRMRAGGADAKLCGSCQRSLDDVLREMRGGPAPTTAAVQ